MRARWLAALALPAALAACSHPGPPVTAGTAIEKQYNPAHNETFYVNGGCINWVTAGKTQICAQYAQIPIEHHYDQSWRVKLQTCTTRPAGQQKCHSSWIKITSQQYTDIKAGVYWNSKST